MILHDGCLHNWDALGAPREPWISDSANITPEVVFVYKVVRYFFPSGLNYSTLHIGLNIGRLTFERGIRGG